MKRIVSITLCVTIVSSVWAVSAEELNANNFQTRITLSDDVNAITPQPVVPIQFSETEIKSSESDKFVIKQKSGSAINNDYGRIAGTLNDTFNYYLFSVNTNRLAILKLVMTNPNYRITLGTVDYATNEVTLTEYFVNSNQLFAINLPAGDYAWIIQSNDATYGQNYTLQYNTSLPEGSNVVAMTADYQKMYTLNGGKLKLNNQTLNLDYKYDVHWETDIASGPAWHTRNIWIENPNVSAAIHVGGFQYQTVNKTVSYPDTIVLTADVGGTWTHYHDQNPPRVFHNYNDMAGKYTPRPIDTDDVINNGSHYLVFDLNTNTVKEFATGLSHEWSPNGSKSNPSLF